MKNGYNSRTKQDGQLLQVRNELTSATKLVGRVVPNAPQSPAADTPEYAYQYDDIGNRITSTDLGTNRTYTANNINQYSAITTSDSGLQTSSFEPQFDDDGNQTLIQTATGIWQVQYNGENRPVLWTGGTQSAVTNIVMSFDRMGRRVKYRESQTTSASGGSTTTINAYHRFLYDNYLCIQRLDAANGNAVDLAFVWDVTEPIATRPLIVDRPEVCKVYVTHDANKNVSELSLHSSPFGAVVHYEYAPFGKMSKIIFSSVVDTIDFSIVNPFLGSSEYADKNLALSYYIYRHYNMLFGRWLNRDFVNEEQGSLHLYIFCKNNYLSIFDVLGLKGNDPPETVSLNISPTIFMDNCKIISRHSSVTPVDDNFFVPTRVNIRANAVAKGKSENGFEYDEFAPSPSSPAGIYVGHFFIDDMKKDHHNMGIRDNLGAFRFYKCEIKVSACCETSDGTSPYKHEYIQSHTKKIKGRTHGSFDDEASLYGSTRLADILTSTPDEKRFRNASFMPDVNSMGDFESECDRMRDEVQDYKLKRKVWIFPKMQTRSR